MKGIRASLRFSLPLLLLLLLVVRPTAPYEDANDLEDLDDLDDLDDLEDLVRDTTVAEEVKIVGRAQRLLQDLNDQSIDRVINSNEYVLLLGYATWCTRSADLMPGFAAAATKLADEGNPAVVAKIDAIGNPGAATRYGIKGYPTFLFFTNGTAQQYSGGHTRDEFVNWVRKRTGLPTRTVSTKAEAQELLHRNVSVVVGYFEAFEGAEYDSFLTVAKEEEGTEFLQISDPEVVKLFNSVAPDVSPALGLQKKEPEYFVTYGGSFKKEDILDFIEVNKYPLINRLSSENMGKVYSSRVKHQVLLFASTEDYETLSPVFHDAALQFKGKIIFIFVDLADEDLSRPMLAVYGLGADKPMVTAFHNGVGSKHVFEAELSSTALKEFCDEFLSGHLAIYQKSEPVPAENKGDVKIVVGKTYSQFLSDETKDLFLQVYTPWCIACEKVNMSFQKVASHLKDVPSIVFAQIDAASNEHSDLEVNKVPALLFYPAGPGTKTPVNPSRYTAKELLQFVREHATLPFTVPDLPTSQKKAGKRKHGDKKDAAPPADTGANDTPEQANRQSGQESESVYSDSVKDEL